MKPGDRLPPEGELSGQFGVGRQTIREAFRILELSGLISVQKGGGGGAIVRNNVLRRTSSLLRDALQMERVSLREYMEARLGLEKVILNAAIDHANKTDIRNLQRNLSECEALVARGENTTELNFQFHSLLARASKNAVFVLFDRTINAIHLDVLKRIPPDFKTDESAFRAHTQILDAVMKKDRESALVLLEKHIEAAYTYVIGSPKGRSLLHGPLSVFIHSAAAEKLNDLEIFHA